VSYWGYQGIESRKNWNKSGGQKQNKDGPDLDWNCVSIPANTCKASQRSVWAMVLSVGWQVEDLCQSSWPWHSHLWWHLKSGPIYY
jgi:hypothetical protein